MSAITRAPALDGAARPNPQPSNAMPSPQGAFETALEALLQSPPNSVRQPKQPGSGQAATAETAVTKRALNKLQAGTGLKAKATSLFNIATEVRKANESLQYAHPDDWDRRRSEPVGEQQPNVYSFLNTKESSLAAPLEVRDFVHGRDKLDVSGIRRQLGKQLQWVNQLSGASGEILLKYSPTKDASVLVISGNPGEPAFVAKVFGQLKETDLVT